jgi:outer membrane murein-binding lipoprotein Lpp
VRHRIDATRYGRTQLIGARRRGILARMSNISRSIAFVRVASAVVTLALLAGCRSPQQDAYLIEQIRQMADELNASRQQTSDIQSQLDSLRAVVARQDTLLTRLAGMAGVPR